MPRTNGVYSPPAGTKGVSNTTIRSAPYNALVDDLTADANAARPISAGGTGATSATAARQNIGAFGADDLKNADAKTSPVDGDGVVITDSADSGKTKRVLWSRIKAVLKSYFDGLYLGLSGGAISGWLEIGSRLTIKSNNNREIVFRTQDNVLRAYILSDATNGVLSFRVFNAEGTTFSEIQMLRDGRVTLPGTVSQNTDATTKSYVDTLASGLLPLAGGTLTGEVISRSVRAYRLANGNGPAVILSKDATNFYLLLTDTWDGTFNSLRPLSVDLATGLVSLLRPQTARNATDPNDLTRKGYVDVAVGTASDAAAAAQSVANAAQNAADVRIIRDSASHAGFAGGDANQPYMRTGTSGSGSVIRLARYDQVAGLATGVNTTVNGVGSYAFLYWNGSVSTINPGTNISGSELAWSNASGANPGTGGPSGSWRLVGYVQTSSALTRTSLWVRYA